MNTGPPPSQSSTVSTGSKKKRNRGSKKRSSKTNQTQDLSRTTLAPATSGYLSDSDSLEFHDAQSELPGLTTRAGGCHYW